MKKFTKIFAIPLLLLVLVFAFVKIIFSLINTITELYELKKQNRNENSENQNQ